MAARWFPILISIYALFRAPAAILPSILGVAAVVIVTHHYAYPLRGEGIALPLFIPPLATAITAILVSALIGGRRVTHVIAFESGVLGTLIGADLMNLDRIADLGAPLASIGGAGTFDGVFLTGIVALLIAGFWGGYPDFARVRRSEPPAENYWSGSR